MSDLQPVSQSISATADATGAATWQGILRASQWSSVTVAVKATTATAVVTWEVRNSAELLASGTGTPINIGPVLIAPGDTLKVIATGLSNGDTVAGTATGVCASNISDVPITTTKISSGAVVISGGSVNIGTITGTVTITGAVTVSGTVNIGSVSGTVTVGGTVAVSTISGTVSISGAVTVSSGTVNIGTISGTVTVAGSVAISSGTVNIGTIAAGNITIVGGQGGATNVGVAMEPYPIGSYTTPNLSKNTSPSMPLLPGTHAVMVIQEGTIATPYIPTTLELISATKGVVWPFNNAYPSGSLSGAQWGAQNVMVGVAYVIDVYDSSIKLVVQDQVNSGNTYKLYGILDTVVVFPDSPAGGALEVQGNNTTGGASDGGVLSVQGTASSGANPIVVKGNNTDGSIGIALGSGESSIPTQEIHVPGLTTAQGAATSLAVNGTATVVAAAAGKTITVYGWHFCMSPTGAGFFSAILRGATSGRPLSELLGRALTAVGVGTVSEALWIPGGMPLAVGEALQILNNSGAGGQACDVIATVYYTQV